MLKPILKLFKTKVVLNDSSYVYAMHINDIGTMLITSLGRFIFKNHVQLAPGMFLLLRTSFYELFVLHVIFTSKERRKEPWTLQLLKVERGKATPRTLGRLSYSEEQKTLKGKESSVHPFIHITKNEMTGKKMIGKKRTVYHPMVLVMPKSTVKFARFIYTWSD